MYISTLVLLAGQLLAARASLTSSSCGKISSCLASQPAAQTSSIIKYCDKHGGISTVTETITFTTFVLPASVVSACSKDGFPPSSAFVPTSSSPPSNSDTNQKRTQDVPPPTRTPACLAPYKSPHAISSACSCFTTTTTTIATATSTASNFSMKMRETSRCALCGTLGGYIDFVQGPCNANSNVSPFFSLAPYGGSQCVLHHSGSERLVAYLPSGSSNGEVYVQPSAKGHPVECYIPVGTNQLHCSAGSAHKYKLTGGAWSIVNQTSHDFLIDAIPIY